MVARRSESRSFPCNSIVKFLFYELVIYGDVHFARKPPRTDEVKETAEYRALALKVISESSWKSCFTIFLWNW